MGIYLGHGRKERAIGSKKGSKVATSRLPLGKGWKPKVVLPSLFSLRGNGGQKGWKMVTTNVGLMNLSENKKGNGEGAKKIISKNRIVKRTDSSGHFKEEG